MALRQSHFLIASWVMPPLAIRKCVCPNAQICSVIQKIVTKYLLSFQIACLVRSLEFNKIFDLLSAHVAFLTPLLIVRAQSTQSRCPHGHVAVPTLPISRVATLQTGHRGSSSTTVAGAEAAK